MIKKINVIIQKKNGYPLTDKKRYVKKQRISCDENLQNNTCHMRLLPGFSRVKCLYLKFECQEL